MKVGRSVEDSLEALRDRLPSREVAVLMTTIVIQQRAGGDTVRALGELAATLERARTCGARSSTLLSGVVFTSYIVAAMAAGTILLINLISPGVTQQMTTVADRHRRARRRGHPVDDRVRADPPDDAGGRLMPLLFGVLAAAVHRARADGDPDAARPGAGGAARRAHRRRARPPSAAR